MIYRESGRTRAAEPLLNQALAIHRGNHDLRLEGLCLADRAVLRVLTGRLDAARRDWSEGRSLLERVRCADDVAQKREEIRKACASRGVAQFGDGPA